MWRRWSSHAEEPGLRKATGSDRQAIREFFAARPVDSVLAAVAVEDIGIAGERVQLLGGADGRISALCWDYGNIIPLGFTPEGLDELAGHLLSNWRTASSIVGPRDQVIGLWRRVKNEWGPARSIRDPQYSMVMGERLLVQPDPSVRVATKVDFPIVFPASVAMYTEEVGYDPTVHGSSYENRVKGLIKKGHTFIKTAPAPEGVGERVIFKADVGACANGVAQMQGVWVAPDQRERGIATAGIAAVTELIQARIAPCVSLYVNSYNAAARAVYAKVGYRTAGEWATILM